MAAGSSVVDFAQLMRQGESRDALSTRVIVTTLGSAQGGDATEASGMPDLLGLIAENVNHVRRYQPNDVVLSAMNLAETPYLGGVVNTQEGLVQIIKPERLLPDRMHASFFQGMADSDSWT
ncbi:MAG: chemotaxis protein CheW [Isosphaeraceae bacterium]